MKEKRGVIGASETAILPPVERFKHSLAMCESLGLILPGSKVFSSFLILLSFCVCASEGWAGAQECVGEGWAGAQDCTGERWAGAQEYEGEGWGEDNFGACPLGALR